MHPRERQFSRGNYPGRRKYRGQYVRSKRSPMRSQSREDGDYHQNQSNTNSSSNNQNSQAPQHHSHKNQSQHQQARGSYQQDVEEIREICSKFSSDIEQVKKQIADIANSLEKIQLNQQQQLQSQQNTQPQKQKPLVDAATQPKKTKERKPLKRRDVPRRSYSPLNKDEIGKIVDQMKQDFFATEIQSVKKTIDAKGPVVARAFAIAMLDHAICDVTSPTKLSDISESLFQILISDEGGLVFQNGVYYALADISKREDDIVIDAPRYIDTLGQVLGQCIIPMNTNRYKQLMRRFLNRCLTNYRKQNRSLLLASIMKGIAGHKTERFAKEIWDLASLKWENFLDQATNMEDFLKTQDVDFTTRVFTPEPKKPKRTNEEWEKFADDVTDLVEKQCTLQDLNNLVRDIEFEPDERVQCMGTLIYAIVRGCLLTDSGDYKINHEALDKYSSLMTGKKQVGRWSHPKKDQQDAIALNALTALTKLWHHYNCPQNLMSNILLALHNMGTASYDALTTWLNSDDLKNIPGIGAARLNSKRFIEDLGNSRS